MYLGSTGDDVTFNYNQTPTGAQTIHGMLTLEGGIWRGTQGTFKVGAFRNLGGTFTSL